MTFDVRDYGALGDGVSDDTAAIQAAIDAAYAAGGGVVYVPEGVYRVSGGEEASDGCLMLKSNVYLQGAGMGETVIKVVDGWDAKITGVIRSAYGEETHDFGVSDLTIDGNRDNNAGKVDGWFNGYIPGQDGADSNVTLERVEIRDCSGYGFDPHEQTINILIKDCVSHGNGLDGFVADYMIDGAFVGNIAYDNDRHGFNIVTSTQDFVLLDNIAYGNGGNGVVVQRGSDNIPSPENILIQGGEYYDNGKEGILIKLSSDVTVDGVNVHGNGSVGVRIYGSSDVQVINSEIHGNALAAANPEVLVQSYDDTAGVSGLYWTAANNLIEGNVITPAGGSTYAVQERNDGSGPTLIHDNSLGTGSKGTTLIYGSGSLVSDDPSGQLLELIEGTAGNDVLVGGSGDQRLLGLAGADTLQGGTGRDQLEGGLGRDRLEGGSGADIFRFTAATDSYVQGGANHSDNILDFDSAEDRIDVSALGFTGFGSSADQLQLVYNAAIDRTYLQAAQANADGQRFSVSLDGDQRSLGAANLIFAAPSQQPGEIVGTPGNDLLGGTSSADTLRGLAGDDQLSGGAGADLLIGGSGRDRLTGGSEADTFRFTTIGDSYRSGAGNFTDIIHDFDPAQDRIDLSSLGFNGLGDGLGGTLQVIYSSAGNRTYLRSQEADSEGRLFELGLDGDHRATLNASNLQFEVSVPTLNGDEQGNLLVGGEQDEHLFGLGGDDSLNGAGGNDCLDGGAGIDSLTGGTGSDTFVFSAAQDSYRNYDAGGLSATDTITDFTPGVDKIDVSALGIYGLGNGYNDTLYITLSDSGTKTYIKSAESDSDGNRFEIALEGDLTGQLSAADFIFSQEQQEILFIPTLGQSNARLLRIYEDDHQSGVTEMVADLERYTDFDSVESLFYDEQGDAIDIAEGGSTVTGASTDSAEQQLLNWWLVDTDQPGYLTLNAVAQLQSQLSTLQARGNVTFAMVWGQGEEAAQTLVASADKTAYLELYKASTLKVFDYIKTQLGVQDASIYMMHTGRYQEEAAAVRGANPVKVAQIVAATELIRQAQDEMAATRDDIKIAVDYQDLPLRYEVDPVLYADDVWHLNEESDEIVGQRLADFIATDLGYAGDPTDNNSPADIVKYPEQIVAAIGDGPLYGTDGAETLDGRNGEHLLVGGEGEDFYIVDSAGDQIIETGLNGEEPEDVEIDRVDSSISWTLGANLEVLTLTGSDTINGTGNELDNKIGGNSAANVLDGGAGVDILIGGNGSDTYYVDRSADKAVEFEADPVIGGIDLVISNAASYILGNNVENLRLLSIDAINGTGNALDNLIYAGDGNNVMNGAGGNDTLSYAFASAGVSVTLSTSQVQDTGGSGLDTVKSFENLEGSAFADQLSGSSGSNSLFGGAGDDVLLGNAGNDLLDGGAGRDTLEGGSGADTYRFSELSDLGLGALRDLIVGFRSSQLDRIDLSALDANIATAENDAFSFIGSEAFSDSDASGQLRFEGGVLYGSVDADSDAEFEIELLGVAALNNSDLLG